MKKKHLFICIIILCIIAAVATVTTIILVNRNSNEGDEPKIEITWKDNMKDIVSITTETTMKDSGVVVYKYVKKLR